MFFKVIIFDIYINEWLSCTLLIKVFTLCGSFRENVSGAGIIFLFASVISCIGWREQLKSQWLKLTFSSTSSSAETLQTKWIYHFLCLLSSKVLCYLNSGPVIPPQRAVLLIQGEWFGQDAPVPKGGPTTGQPHLPGLLQQRCLPLPWQRAPTGRQTHESLCS